MQSLNAEDMYFPRLAERVEFFKGDNDEGGEKVMGYFEEREEKAVKRAEKKISEKIARTFLAMEKLTVEEIASGTGLTLKRVQRLAETL